MSKRHSRFGVMFVGILSVTLTGCAMTTASKGPTSVGFCKVAEPIYWSGKDTEKTIAQVKEHNAVGKKLCQW